MIISCFASFKVFIGERLGKKFGDEGYEEAGAAVLILGEEASARKLRGSEQGAVDRVDQGALSLLGSVLAIVGAAYIRLHADRLERTSPFFGSFDMAMGGVFTVGVLLLTLIHWGPTLTTIVALAIVYFFYGQHIDHPLFSHSGVRARLRDELHRARRHAGVLPVRADCIRRHFFPRDLRDHVVWPGHDADDRRGWTTGGRAHQGRRGCACHHRQRRGRRRDGNGGFERRVVRAIHDSADDPRWLQSRRWPAPSRRRRPRPARSCRRCLAWLRS